VKEQKENTPNIMITIVNTIQIVITASLNTNMFMSPENTMVKDTMFITLNQNLAATAATNTETLIIVVQIVMTKRNHTIRRNPARKVQPVLLVRPAVKDQQVVKVRPVVKDQQVVKGQQVIKVQLVLRGPLVKT
jgi:hypothetical protein